MPSRSELSPFARALRRNAAMQEGQTFLQRLAAGIVAAPEQSLAARPLPDDEAPDWPDLDQRVRAVGEW